MQDGTRDCDETTQLILRGLCNSSAYFAIIPVMLSENNSPLNVEEIENRIGKFPHKVLETLKHFGIIYDDAKGISLTAIKGPPIAKHLKKYVSTDFKYGLF